MSTLKQITDLETLDQHQLKSKWRELFGQEPPAYRRGFLIKGLAYRIQELTHGGLSEKAQKRIKELAHEQATGKNTVKRSPKNTPIIGTRLIREWQGVRHEVTVAHDGFEYLGRTYKSLSVVARTITGTRWSGPLFFGLRNHSKTTTLMTGETAS